MVENLLSSGAIDGAFVPLARSEIENIDIEGELLLFDARLGAWHLLNPLAGLVWKCCDGSGSVEEICRDLSEAFDQDLAEVQQRVQEVLRQFGDNGLLDGIQEAAASSGHGHNHGDQTSDRPDGTDESRFLGVPPSS